MRASSCWMGLLILGCGASGADRAHVAAQQREVRLCAGLSQEEAHGPFRRREDIVSVEPVVTAQSEWGARTVFRPEPGTTVDEVRHEVACELARESTDGRPERGNELYPESVPGAIVNVSRVAGGIAVDVFAAREQDAAEILRRARMLARR